MSAPFTTGPTRTREVPVTEPPFFSVIIPVFNAARFLLEALESVSAQTFGDFEIIAIDDGSSDDSSRIIEAHAKRDDRVVTRSRQSQGVAATRNEGVHLATGRYVAFMDADDVAVPRRLELQRRYLQQHPDCVALGGQTLFIDHEGLPMYRSDFPLDHDAIDRTHMTGGGCVLLQGAAAVNRNAILEVGGYRERYPVAEDLDLLLRLAETGRLANIDEILIHYRLHPASLTHTNLASGTQWAEAAIRDACLRRGIPTTGIEVPQPRNRNAPTELVFRAMKAHRSGFSGTARRYAARALTRRPASPTAWWVMLVVLFPGALRRLRTVLGVQPESEPFSSFGRDGPPHDSGS